MKMCKDHWERLKQAIDDRGLSGFISSDGGAAVKSMVSQADEGITVDNFDPLMGAHNAILMTTIEVVGLAVMATDGPDDGHWCPLCYLNQAHEKSCTDPACVLDKENGYDLLIDKAADDQLKISERL